MLLASLKLHHDPIYNAHHLISPGDSRVSSSHAHTPNMKHNKQPLQHSEGYGQYQTHVTPLRIITRLLVYNI